MIDIVGLKSKQIVECGYNSATAALMSTVQRLSVFHSDLLYFGGYSFSSKKRFIM